jgi:hypothetical protein
MLGAGGKLKDKGMGFGVILNESFLCKDFKGFCSSEKLFSFEMSNRDLDSFTLSWILADIPLMLCIFFSFIVIGLALGSSFIESFWIPELFWFNLLRKEFSFLNLSISIVIEPIYECFLDFFNNFNKPCNL